MAVTLSQTTATLYAGYTLLLTATDSLSGTITWSTSDSSSMTVVGGLVTCLIGKGNINITATSSAGGSATCVVTGYGISIGKVGKMLGMSSTSLGTLCNSTKVNKFSIVHPIKNTSVKGPDNVWSTTGQQFYLSNGGGMTPSKWESSDTLSTFLGQITAATTTNWPVDTIPSNYPKRLGDFRGYTANKNASMMQKINDGLSYLYYSCNPSTMVEYTERANWDTFILENSGTFGVKKFSDIWLDSSGTDNLSNYYLTVITKNTITPSTYYFVKSLGLISTLFDSDGISLVIELENIIQRSLVNYTDYPDVERWYFLSQNSISSATAITGTQLNTETYSNSTLGLGKVYQIPLYLKNGTPFYIKNTIGTRTYIKIKFKNNRTTSRTLLFGLYNQESGSEDETLLSTNEITFNPGETTAYYVFNNVRSGNDYLRFRVISGLQYDDSLKLDWDNNGIVDMVRRVDTLGKLFMPMDTVFEANANDWHTYDLRMWLEQEGVMANFRNDSSTGSPLIVTLWGEDTGSSFQTNVIKLGDSPLFREGKQVNGLVWTTNGSATVTGNTSSTFLTDYSTGSYFQGYGGFMYVVDHVVSNQELVLTTVVTETLVGVLGFSYESVFMFHFGVLYTMRVIVASGTTSFKMRDWLASVPYPFTPEYINFRDQNKQITWDANHEYNLTNYQVETPTTNEIWFKFYMDMNALTLEPRPTAEFYK